MSILVSTAERNMRKRFPVLIKNYKNGDTFNKLHVVMFKNNDVKSKVHNKVKRKIYSGNNPYYSVLKLKLHGLR